jgi:hypothetical protein
MFAFTVDDLAGSEFEFTYCMSAARISQMTLQMQGWNNIALLEWADWRPRSDSAKAEYFGFLSKLPLIRAILKHAKRYIRQVVSLFPAK